LQNGLAQTNTKVAEVETQTNKNTADIAVQGGAITVLQTGLAATNVQVAENTKDIAKLDNRVGNLENRMNGFENMTKGYAYSAAAMGMAAAGIVFDPRLERQIGMAASTVGGKSAMAIGIAVRQGNAIVNMKS